MSTVLWANRLDGGRVTSDRSDKYALYRHTRKLDSICRELAVLPLSEMCDLTDMRFNVDESTLPPGLASTDEVMAQTGTWVDAQQALDALAALLARVESEDVRFGWIRNEHDDVVAELEESIEFARRAVADGASFNFSVVM